MACKCGRDVQLYWSGTTMCKECAHKELDRMVADSKPIARPVHIQPEWLRLGDPAVFKDGELPKWGRKGEDYHASSTTAWPPGYPIWSILDQRGQWSKYAHLLVYESLAGFSSLCGTETTMVMASWVDDDKCPKCRAIIRALEASLNTREPAS